MIQQLNFQQLSEIFNECVGNGNKLLTETVYKKQKKIIILFQRNSKSYSITKDYLFKTKNCFTFRLLKICIMWRSYRKNHFQLASISHRGLNGDLAVEKFCATYYIS